jgi:cellulose synthase/poly-beta-1,6-N-acetylglucosamine synthase-like glycosyltransferase/ActR/RegA family two-component response regulator
LSEITSVTQRQKNIRVLIVDDSSSFRRELRNYLESERGITVVGEAENGLQAIEMTELKKPDVVLMDQSMPKLSGVGATSRIKASQPGTRVIFVAAEGRWQQDAILAGAERYFLKEDDLLELTEAIKDPMAGLRPVVTAEPQREIGRFLGDKWLWRGASALLGVSYIAALIASPQITLLWTSLICGVMFFIYGLKYYLSVALVLFATSGNGNNHNGVRQGRRLNGFLKNGLFNNKAKERGDGKGNGRGLNGLRLANGGNGRFPHHLQPFISIHLPLYNETAVVDRLLTACTSLDYENYEVIVADDSTDDTSQILKDRWESHPRVKLSHRIGRSGFKGGALRVAMGRMDPRTEFIVIFDADFVPQPDILHQFLAYFYGTNGANGHHHPIPQGTTKLDLVDKHVAVVQGYQWHMLNASENWITRGIRSEYSGSYVVERSCQEFLGSMKMISGSVFMIRADVLKKVGWRTSITEDWELTLRLYLEGYKVLYTPFIQAPAECVASFRDLSRQRMRWAEGHTFNVKKYFLRVLQTPNISRREKLEFIYFAPYYLQSAFFLLGTGAWLITDLLLNVDLPFWTATLGWSLVFANGFSLILMNLAGLFLERGIRRNWAGLLSFILLTYLLVPYQAYAALKGLFEPHEGGWHRTTKTGVITEIVERLGLRRRLRRILPKQQKRSYASASRLVGFKNRLIQSLPSPFRRLLGPGGLRFRLASGLAISILLLAILAARILVVSAAPDSFYLRDTATTGASPAGEDMNSVQGSSEDTLVFDSAEDETYWYTDVTYPSGGDDATLAAGSYALNMYFNQLPSDWWDTTYKYRQPITITAGSADVPSNYSIRLEFNHDSLAPAKSLSNGDDVRIVYWTGSEWNELDRRLDDQSSWDSETTQIWFSTQASINATESDTDYYLYYGNSGAGTPPTNWKNIFLFYDDFNDGIFDSTDRWTCTMGTCTESGGSLTLNSDERLLANASYAIGTDTRWEARTALGGSGLDTYFNYWNAGTASYFDGDFICFWSDGTGHQAENQADWSSTSYNFTPSSPTSQHLYAFNREGSASVRYFQDTNELTNTTSDVPTGNLRAFIWNDGTGYDQVVDFVRVRKCVSTEPSASPGEEENAPFVKISVTVYHTKGDGTDPQEIVTSAATTIDANTLDPYALTIGSGSEQTFTSTDPRRLRLHIDVTEVNGSGSFTLAYDSVASPSSLDTPEIVVPGATLLLLLVVVLIPITTSLMTRRRWLGFSIAIGLLLLAIVATRVPLVEAAVEETSNVFYFYDDMSPQTYMMYQAQPTGSDQSGSATIEFYSDTFPDTWSIQQGTTSVYIYVVNASPLSEDNIWALYAGSSASWTYLGQGSMGIDSFMSGYQQLDFATDSYEFAEGEQLKLVASDMNLTDIYWDGSYNQSRVTVPGLTVIDPTLMFLILVPLFPILIGLLTRKRRLAVRIISAGLSFLVVLTLLAQQIIPVSAAPDVFYLRDTTTNGASPAGQDMNLVQGSSENTLVFDSVDDEAYWYTDVTYPAGEEDASIAAGNYTLNMHFDQLPQVPADWYNTSWLYRKEITVYGSQVAVGGVSNFPVLINLTSDTELAAKACNAPSAGYDILFTSSNGTSKLSHEIESFDDSTGALVAWVKVPALTNPADTTIYMYYGNSSCTDQQDVANVWASYVGVWHFTESSGTGYYLKNSRQDDYHADDGYTQYLSGSIIGGGRDVNDDYATVQNGTDLLDGDTSFTLEFWGYPDYATDQDWVDADEDIFLDSDSLSLCRWKSSGTGTGWIQCDVQWTTGPPYTSYSNCTDCLNRAEWNHIVLTYDGTNLRWYINGTQRYSENNSGKTLETNSLLHFGSEQYLMDSNFDEFRYARAGLGVGWFQTEYNNQGDPSNFYGLGSEETLPSVEIAVSVYHTDADGSNEALIVENLSTLIDTTTINGYELPIGTDDTGQTFPAAAPPQRLRLHINPSALNTPGIVIPEWGGAFLVLMPLIPYLMTLIWQRKRRIGNYISLLLAGCVAIGLLATNVPSASAAPTLDVNNSTTFWWYDDTTPLQYMMYQSVPSPPGTEQNASNTTVSFYSDTWPAGWSVNGGTGTVYFYVQTTGVKKVDFTLLEGSGSTWNPLGSGQWSGNQRSKGLVSFSFSTSSNTFTANERLRLDVQIANRATVYWDGSSNNSRLVTPTIVVPENAIAFVAVAALIPIVMGAKNHRKRKLPAFVERY